MAATSHELPPPPETQVVVVRVIAGLITLLLLGLALYAVLATPAQVATPPPTAAPLRLAITPAAEPPAPVTELITLLDPPAAALPAGCPPAETLPEGTRAGWIARAAGCPDVLFASVGGQRRWVRRPADFPEDLYSQLPELQP